MMYSKGTQVGQANNGGSLGSKANFALTDGLLTLPIHKYIIKEKYMHQERAPSYVA